MLDERTLRPQRRARFVGSSSDRGASETRLTSLRGIPSRRALSQRVDSSRRRDVHGGGGGARRGSTVDTRRYVTSAKNNSNASLHNLLRRLRTYRTFAPLFDCDEGINANATTANTLAVYSEEELTRDTLNPHMNLWETIDVLLDTSLSNLMRHNTNDHFFTMLDHVVPETTRMRPRKTVIVADSPVSPQQQRELQTSTGATYPSKTPAPPSTIARGNPIVVHSTRTSSSGAVMAGAWARDHPIAATADRVREEMDFWEDAAHIRDRASQSQYLLSARRDLATLRRQSTSHFGSAAAPLLYPGQTRITLTSPSPVHDCENKARQQREALAAGQKEAWWKFTTGRRTSVDGCASFGTAALSSPRGSSITGHSILSGTTTPRNAGTALAGPFMLSAPCMALATASFNDSQQQQQEHQRRLSSGVAATYPLSHQNRVVCDYEDSSALHEWVQSGWMHHTHRHENAALRIQSAFRVYCARRITALRRHARFLAFAEAVKAEADAFCQWEVASKLSWQQRSTTGEADKVVQSMRFFMNKINAVVEIRRARRKAAADVENEIHEYAALTIQRVYRGHLGREQSGALRHPEQYAEKQKRRNAHYAVVIQSAWRCYSATRRWNRMRTAAATIQRAFRCHAARVHLLALRRTGIAECHGELRRHAASVIERFFLRLLAEQRCFYSRHKAYIDRLQRVGRGLLQRRALGQWEKTAERLEVARKCAQRWRAAKRVRCAKTEARRRRDWWKRECDVRMMQDAASTIQHAWRNYVGRDRPALSASDEL